jgi:hypothetical protein
MHLRVLGCVTIASIVIRLRAELSWVGFPGKSTVFSYSMGVRKFFTGGHDVKLTIHLPLMPRFMGGAIPLLPYTPSWCGQGQLHLYLFTTKENNY